MTALLALAACTGDDDESSPTTTAADWNASTAAPAGGVVDCGTVDVESARASDPSELIDGYACLRQAFGDRRPAALTLFLLAPGGGKTVTTYVVEGDTILVSEDGPNGQPAQQRCTTLEGDDDGSVRPAECSPV